jgi:2-amino-4-hydroxy-6-hydroxymethyldihydropteridine diphosphokinase
MHKVYLGLGSNLGNRQQNIEDAVRLVQERVGQVVRQSSLMESEPWGFESCHNFLNAVILCQTTKTPREVLTLTQQIERDLGREKKSARLTVEKSTRLTVSQKSSDRQYADRPIDIDILLYDDLTVDEPDLKIPHPLMHKRDFVMKPLREIYQPD